ncbi:MAG: type IV secretion system DNA-binding domain-containing protein [Candidatus Harrisonbacteria bacterium]|nr:type IV secretion system DNA-binding domain-containing protein [Candidatus Harrisonbacteria bacterium]
MPADEQQQKEQELQKLQTVKTAPPPADLPILGKVDERELSFLGRSNYASALDEKKFVFGIKRADRRANMYILGKSGVGKTKLMELMIRQDIERGSGLCLFDPHGDLIEEILHFIPERRMKDVVIVDPSDPHATAAFNPFANISEEFRYQMAQGMIEIMEAQFGSQWTPAMEHVFRFAVLGLAEHKGAALNGLIRLFTEPEYRQAVASSAKDPMIKRFWLEEYQSMLAQPKIEREVITPLINKLNQFLLNPILGKMFSQAENKVSVQESIEKKRILLINLARGKLGKENASFLASLFLLKFKQAGIRRLHLPEKERHDFYLYIDEFHHLVTETFENLLFEGKKYHLPLTIAHQYLGQVIDHFKNSVLANIGTIIVFRLGGDDALHMESELAPVFRAKNIVNLGSRQFYIKMLINGEPHDPFSAETLKVLSPRHPSFKQQILEHSRAQYGIGGQKRAELTE